MLNVVPLSKLKERSDVESYWDLNKKNGIVICKCSYLLRKDTHFLSITYINFVFIEYYRVFLLIFIKLKAF